MFRFDPLIRRDMIVRDVRQRRPETARTFFIETKARVSGLKFPDVLDALDQAAFGPSADTQKPCQS
jgi:hypothetical protein